MDITTLLKMMVDQGASDLFLTVGSPPQMKVEGAMKMVGSAPLKSMDVNEMARSIMNDSDSKTFESTLELNNAISFDNIGRFRFNVFKQRGETAVVARYIKGKIPSIDELALPPILRQIVMELRGFVLVVGSTGSGKSTSLAAMIDYRNQQHEGHILTIEDPIEFVHTHKKSIVNQREIGIDTLSYENALMNAMRESPDVIVVGEIRDRATMKYALDYAETGHLCIATLHANNTNQALDRIISFFPDEAKKQLLLDISLNLKAIISLRLVPGIEQKRMPAVEVLLNTPYITDLIEHGKIDEIKTVMGRSIEEGMQTFDHSLIALFRTGKITEADAIRFADSKNNVALELRLTGELTEKSTDGSLAIQPDPKKPDPPLLSPTEKEDKKNL
jgi:twitching motility protein PilU